MTAFFKHEIGNEVVRDRLEQGGLLLSSINRTELKGKLVGAGLSTPRDVNTHLLMFDQLLEVIPFDLEQSDLAAYYYAQWNAYQLSLSDCACLALAKSRGVEVLTAERVWAKLPDLPVKVKLIQPRGNSRDQFTIRCVMVRVMFRQNLVARPRGSRITGVRGVRTLKSRSSRLKIALSANLEKMPSATRNLEVLCHAE